MTKHHIIPALSIALLLSAVPAHAQYMTSGSGATSPEKSSTSTNVDTSIERRPQVGPNSNTGLTISTPVLSTGVKKRTTVNTDVQANERTGVRTGTSATGGTGLSNSGGVNAGAGVSGSAPSR